MKARSGVTFATGEGREHQGRRFDSPGWGPLLGSALLGVRDRNAGLKSPQIGPQIGPQVALQVALQAGLLAVWSPV